MIIHRVYIQYKMIIQDHSILQMELHSSLNGVKLSIETSSTIHVLPVENILCK